MVKSLTAIALSVLLLAGLGVYEWYFVQTQFGDFQEELSVLYRKAEEESANGEDAKAVQTKWEERKSKLHVWIPHNDISRVDDYMAETVRLLGERNYALALPKIEILRNIAKTIPSTYLPAVENIF